MVKISVDGVLAATSYVFGGTSFVSTGYQQKMGNATGKTKEYLFSMPRPGGSDVDTSLANEYSSLKVEVFSEGAKGAMVDMETFGANFDLFVHETLICC